MTHYSNWLQNDLKYKYHVVQYPHIHGIPAPSSQKKDFCTRRRLWSQSFFYIWRIKKLNQAFKLFKAWGLSCSLSQILLNVSVRVPDADGCLNSQFSQTFTMKKRLNFSEFSFFQNRYNTQQQQNNSRCVVVVVVVLAWRPNEIRFK